MTDEITEAARRVVAGHEPVKAGDWAILAGNPVHRLVLAVWHDPDHASMAWVCADGGVPITVTYSLLTRVLVR